MTILQMLQQSGILTLLGMLVVFGFLIVMIFAMRLLHAIIRGLGLEKNKVAGKEPSSIPPNPANEVKNDFGEEVAAIAAALYEKEL